jgi:P pilus assembly chaperone PapD
MLSFYRRWLVACCLLPLLSAHAAGSIPLAVAPVMVKMDMATEFGAIEISNRGDQATGMEVEMMRVQWVDGHEQYESTPDFVVSPAAFRLAPNKARMIRFRFSGARQDTEGFYRLFLRQLPEALPGSQINMVFNLGVPVFIAPHNVRPALALSTKKGNNPVSELHNTGNVTLRLLKLEGANCAPAPEALAGRISPNQKLTLKINVSQCATGIQTDHGLIPLSAP